MKHWQSRTDIQPNGTYTAHTLRYQATKRPEKRGPELDAWKARRKDARKEVWS